MGEILFDRQLSFQQRLLASKKGKEQGPKDTTATLWHDVSTEIFQSWEQRVNLL